MELSLVKNIDVFGVVTTPSGGAPASISLQTDLPNGLTARQSFGLPNTGRHFSVRLDASVYYGQRQMLTISSMDSIVRIFELLCYVKRGSQWKWEAILPRQGSKVVVVRPEASRG